MEREWHKIISFNGSQSSAFEELACQIAMSEKDKQLKSFERVGTPDGGVECYWQLFVESEWGWQAKYYENLTSSEWAKIKESLYDAVETHSNLSKYFICLPHNLSDGRRGKKSQKDSWEFYKKNWQADLANRGLAIEIILWNSSELFQRLSQPELRGTRNLFFKEIEIDEDRIFKNLQNSITSLGPKYSKSLNLKIESIVKPFDALARNQDFVWEFTDVFDNLIIKIRKIISDFKGLEKSRENQIDLTENLSELLKIYAEIDFSPIKEIPVKDILLISDSLEANIKKVLRVYLKNEEELRDQKKLFRKEYPDKPFPDHLNYPGEYKYEYEISDLNKFSRELDKFKSYIGGYILKIANDGALILKGNWGTGKSHLLADIATNQMNLNVPCIFMLGMQFPEIPPLNFIQQTLCPKYNLEEYLEALNALGKVKGQRIFFIIDAINEGKGKFIWKDNVNAVINEFRHYNWLGFVLSYRTTYEKLLIPENCLTTMITHNGFRGMEDYATKEYFNFYKIQQTVPLLNPEFSTPLFLKIFCKTLNNLGLNKVEDGYDGISKIFSNFVGSINKKIGERLDYPYEKVNPVLSTIDGLIKYQLTTGEYIVPYEKAHDIAEAAISKYSNQKNSLEELLRENLLVEDYLYNHSDHKLSQNGISFSYERMIDHFKAKYLLQEIDGDNIKKSFKKGGRLYTFFFDKRGFYGFNLGLLNSLAVLIPEKFDLELYEVFELGQSDYFDDSIYKAVLESILWRHTSTINEKLWSYFKKQLNESYDDLKPEFLNTIFHVCANKDNYFNSSFVHNLLQSKSLAERDFIWSIPVGRIFNWNEDSSVKRILNWCWSTHIDEYEIDDESAINVGSILAWFFTSSNRYLRDKASKAFVSLFVSKAHLLRFMLDRFKLVNDPYVLERIIAGIYGVCSRSSDDVSIRNISQYVYDLYFKSKSPPTNILTRDYCKCIVESAINRKISIKYKLENLLPPFRTVFPKDIPDKAWVKKQQIVKAGNEKYTDKERGFFRLLFSFMDAGDFSRYIIGTNHRGSGSFAAFRLKSKIAYDILISELRGQAKLFFEAYCSSIGMLDERSDLGKKIRRFNKGENQADFFKNDLKMQSYAKTYLEKKLTKRQHDLFKLSDDYIKNGLYFNRKYDAPKFDLSLIERYVLKRVLDLGWSMDLFGEYDCRNDESGRTATKSERVGKKYQWIAFYEIMALLSDHFGYLGQFNFNDEQSKYIGAWQEGLRNFDPSVILRPISKSEADDKRKMQKKVWWFAEPYNNWNENRNDWLKKFNDLPNISNLIQVTNPEDNSVWYVLYGHFSWDKEKELGVEKYKSCRRELWASVYGLLVKKNRKNFILKSGSDQLHWIRSEIPERRSYYGVYQGELFNSDAYNDVVINHENYPYSNLKIKGIDTKAIHTTEDMSIGDEYHCSQERFSLLKPSKFLFELLDARFGENDSCIYDSTGNIIGYDTYGYFNVSHSCFLVRKDIMDMKLAKSDFDIIWYFFGEKEDIGPNVSFVYRMLFSGFAGFNKQNLSVFPFFQKER